MPRFHLRVISLLFVMNPLEIYDASGPVLADDLKDVSWIYALQAKLNPFSLEPSESASIAIYHSWHAILSNLVICDLRVGALGARVHAWKSKRCLIVYKLSPDTDYIRSLGFFDEDDIIFSEKADAWKDICLRYALNATWIFCPAISSDPDVEVSHNCLLSLSVLEFHTFAAPFPYSTDYRFLPELHSSRSSS